MQAKEGASISRSLLIFYVLVIYVFLQFLWWSYLLFDLNGEVSRLRSEIAMMKGEEADALFYAKALKNKWLMIFGEGMVFLILLALGIVQTRKTFKKELALIRQQKNFLLSITHELKSPLASIKLYLQTIGKREFEKEKRDEIIKKAIADTDRLNNLVENMLLASRVENSGFQLQLLPLNLSELIHDYVKHLKSEIQHQNRIQIRVESNLYILGDKLYVTSMVANLVENALKYSPDDKPVNIKLSNQNELVVLQVADEGTGIPEYEKLNIFMKFYRAGNEETRKTKGTGLGLYIVAKLATLHKATLSVMDNSPQGSIFELKFKTFQTE
ncbi:MAG: sensor histidine kinase [Flavobacteriales bacterium]